MIDGRTVMELNEGSRSAKEVVGLWDYVADRLGRLRAEAASEEVVAVPSETVVHGIVPKLHGRPKARGFGRRATGADESAMHPGGPE
jgi:chromosome partitioning protein